MYKKDAYSTPTVQTTRAIISFVSRAKCIVIFCVLALVLILLSAFAFGEEAVDTQVPDLTAQNSGETFWEFQEDLLVGSVHALQNDGCGGLKYDSQTGSLTLKNEASERRILSFEYFVYLRDGSISVDETSVTSNGLFIKELDGGDTVSIVLTSNNLDARYTTIELSNIKLIAIKSVDVTFKAPVHGSYTVDGQPITTDTSQTYSNTSIVTLEATPDSGFKHVGWIDEISGEIFSLSSLSEKPFFDNAVISPLFALDSDPYFKVGLYLFSDLNDALSYAATGNTKTVTLVSSGTLPEGNYVVPCGVTLLIPSSDSFHVFREAPDIIYNEHVTPYAFKELTMATGASITVSDEASISLSGQLSSKGQLGGWNGTPTGSDGRIKMHEGSSITLENGGNLYCWGYIHGSGLVTINAGATVFEAFQIKDWRGGTRSSDILNHVFILNQYYVQNIEVPMKLYAGASEVLYSAINAASAAYPASASFIGDSGCLFNVTNGYIIKDYVESRDRLQVDVYGDISVAPMTLNELPVINSISTDTTILPITSNLTINIHSGTTTVQQDIELLPGVEFSIDRGAECVVSEGKSIYVYDNDDWGNFTGAARLHVIGYSVANGTTAIRDSSSLVDAVIDVNGTLTVGGKIFTSLGGANITSTEGTGLLVFSSAPLEEDTTIQEDQNNNTLVDVTFNPARLHNGPDRADGIDEYVATLGSAAGTTFKYCKTCDIWDDSHTHTITWVINGEEETEEVEIGTVPTHETPVKASDSQFAYNFAAWFPTPVEVTGDATYTAEFAGHEIATATDDANLKLSARTLYLYNDLSIVYKINASTITAGGFTDPYLICTINNRAVRVNGTLKTDEDHVDKYFFEFKNVNPQQMATSVYTYVYATKNGALTRGTAMTTYSVRKYAENQLAKAATPAVLRTLLVDLLNYGTAAQVYSNHRTVDLANSTLTAEQLAYGSTEVPELVSVSGQGPEIDSPSVTWKGVTLMLDKAVQIRLEIECADISGLKASVVTDYGRTYEITSDKLVPVGSSNPNRYYVFINEVNFARLRSRYDVTFLNASDEPVSRTYSYSAASYAFKRIENPSTPANLLALVDRLMKFGASVEAYVATM